MGEEWRITAKDRRMGVDRECSDRKVRKEKSKKKMELKISANITRDVRDVKRRTSTSISIAIQTTLNMSVLTRRNK